MNIVLDTNVLVSALWSADSKPAAILNQILSGRFRVCYDHRILEEYYNVLRRPKFGFSQWEVSWLLDFIRANGISVIPQPLSDVPFADESDRKFLEVAKFCFAPLITGNMKHYPQDENIISVSDFHRLYIG